VFYVAGQNDRNGRVIAISRFFLNLYDSGNERFHTAQHSRNGGPVANGALDVVRKGYAARLERSDNCEFVGRFELRMSIIPQEMSAASFYHRQPGRYATQKQEFHGLMQSLKRLALEHRYTRRELAEELGISIPCLNQWLRGHYFFATRTSGTFERVFV
jgi:hypothetical protein